MIDACRPSADVAGGFLEARLIAAHEHYVGASIGDRERHLAARDRDCLP